MPTPVTFFDLTNSPLYQSLLARLTALEGGGGGGGVAGVASVNTRTGAVVLTALDVALQNVSNKTDATRYAENATLTNKIINGADNTITNLAQSSVTNLVNTLASKTDVFEFANFAAFPATGAVSKLYIAADTNLIYRWAGSAYVAITGGAGGDIDGGIFGSAYGGTAIDGGSL